MKSKSIKLNAQLALLASICSVFFISSVLLVSKTYPFFVDTSKYLCSDTNQTKVLFSLPLAGLVSLISFGMISLLTQLGKARLVIKQLSQRQIKLTPQIISLTAKLKIKSEVILIKDNLLYSFCSGFFQPKIFVSTELINLLNENELEAVLIHEYNHIREHDHLKLVIGHTFSKMFFFLPIVQKLANNIVIQSEIVADKAVIWEQRTNRHIKSALRKILVEATIEKPLNILAPAISAYKNLSERFANLGNAKVEAKNIFGKEDFVKIAISAFVLLFEISLAKIPTTVYAELLIKNKSYLVCSPYSTCSNQCVSGKDTVFGNP